MIVHRAAEMENLRRVWASVLPVWEYPIASALKKSQQSSISLNLRHIEQSNQAEAGVARGMGLLGLEL